MTAFERLPVTEQIEHLDSRLGDGDPVELLALCAEVRDHMPLGWLSAALLLRGWLDERASQEAFAAFLLEQPDTAVQRVAREMLDVGAKREALRDTLMHALRACPLERLSSGCILDRVLKHNFPQVRDAYVAERTEAVIAALRAGKLDGVDEVSLVAVAGRSTAELLDAARAGGVAPAFEELRRNAAMRAIDVLSEAPKAVSQANAEELLSTRVYTDPGHFLIELLQNAEDAGATRWRVSFEPERVVVWHNGAPFDFRDVVGVTSIGQTTKRKTQIGFFGVGFKSVYEITARPQVFSDVFDFEIVDVSVPRWLGKRPQDVPADGTVLVLPLRDPASPGRTPAELYEKARRLDPCVLFTLRRIDEIELELGAGCEGGPQQWLLRESAPDEHGRSVIDVAPAGERLHYMVRDDTYAYVGGREAGRADSTPVMVGVRLDERGAPRPLDEAAPNVYSYLPTDERAGFRFFVQGHFDVPVDRERITPESSWNRWVLEQVPSQLGRIAQQLATRNGASSEAARGFLNVLPLANELNSPIFRVVPAGLKAALGDVPVLPCTDGAVHAPGEVLVATPEVAGLLGDARLDAAWLTRHDGKGARFLLAPDLPPRSVEVALALGAGTFDFTDLLDVVVVSLRSDEDTLPLRGARRGDLAELARLYDVLLEHIERTEREESRLKAAGLVRRLRDTPLVACADGELRRASKVERAGAAIRAVFGGARAFVAEPFDRSLWGEDEDEHPKRVDAFLDRLGVRVCDASVLITELVDAAGRHGADGGASLRAMHAAVSSIRDHLAEHERRRLGLASVWPDRAGRLRPLRGGGDACAWVPRDAELPELVGELAFVDATIAELAYVADIAEPVGADWLVERIAALDPTAPLFTDRARLEGLAAYLGRHVEEMTQHNAARLGSLPIFVAEVEGQWRNMALGVWESGLDASRGYVCDDDVAQVVAAVGLPRVARTATLDALLAAGIAERVSVETVLSSVLNVGPVAAGASPSPLQTRPALAAIHALLIERIGAVSGAALADLAVIGTVDGGVARASDLIADTGQLAFFAPQSRDRAFVASVLADASGRALVAALEERVRLRTGCADVLDAMLHRAGSVSEHPHLCDASRRAAFYGWVGANLDDIVADAAAQDMLRAAPFFPTSRGALVPITSLLVDADLPDLGIDWKPAPEIPVELLARAARLLGSRRLPGVEMLLEATTHVRSLEQSSALAYLLSELYRADEIDDDALGRFGREAWVMDGEGELRRPGELFTRTPSVEAIAGDFPDLYAAEPVDHHIGAELGKRVGFRTARDVPLEQVVRNLRHNAERGGAVRLSLYGWLDKGLEEGWIDASALKELLGETPWIFTDDELWFHDTQVLGARELQLFGPRRGYWVRGAAECPTLCAAFGIPTEVTPSAVVAFLTEIAEDAALRGDRLVLEAEPALPRMLLACYAYLGQRTHSPGREVPILCMERRAATAPTLRLRGSRAPSLFRSDTPTLEAMFESVGTIHVAAKGMPEQSASIDDFYARAGVRRLRETYEVRVAKDAGADRTQSYQQQIQTLRAWFRSLCGVLGRVQQQRGGPDDAWLYRDVLADLVERCAIRAVDDLRVRFVLSGIGEVTQAVPAAFDPEARELLVDTRSILEPHEDPTGLALGLMPTIYDGPGEDQVTDIIVILLPLRTRERMDDYLDHRHFPVAAQERTAAQRVAERLLEVLDFGLDRRLAAGHAELRGVSLARWRDPSVASRAVSQEGAVTKHGAALLLDAVGVSEPTDALIDALFAVLVASSIDDVPAEAFGHAAAPGPRDPTDAPAPAALPVPTPAATPWAGELPPLLPLPPLPPLPRAEIARGVEVADFEESYAPPEPQAGFFAAVKRFFGVGDAPVEPPAPMPTWTAPDANPFDAVAGIGPQLWVTKERLGEVAQARTGAGLGFDPAPLPRPYLYAVRTMGRALRPESQHWLPLGDGDLPPLAPQQPTGQIVRFRGTLGPGLTQLVMPLHSRIVRRPTGTDAELRRRADGTIWLTLEERIETEYAVELLEPPLLLHDIEFRRGLEPPATVPLGELPPEVRELVLPYRWQPVIARALAAEAFVREHYVYDPDFMLHPRVVAARRKLRPDESHHLALLHASRSGDVLGRGICYELNLMVVEILRHMRVTAFCASGWVLDRGVVDRADHLFAVAVVPSVGGATLLPLDAATTERGAPIRPMASASAPDRTPSIVAPTGAWNPATQAADIETARLAQRSVLLNDVVTYLARRLRVDVRDELDAILRLDLDHAGVERLTALGVRLLDGDTELFAALVTAFGEPEIDPAALSAQIAELVDRGFVTVRTVPRYRIELVDRG